MRYATVLCFASLTVSLLFVACSSTSATRLTDQSYPALSENERVRVYEEEPDTSFVKVARVSAEEEATTIFGSVTEGDLIPMLKKEARRLGANGLMQIETQKYEPGRDVGAMSANAIAIRVGAEQ